MREYSLRDLHKPIGINEYRLLKLLPDDLKGTLLTIKEIEERLRLDEDPGFGETTRKTGRP